jgi:hypothetical protein
LNKQVTGELGISEITLKAHRRRVMQNLLANSLPDPGEDVGRAQARKEGDSLGSRARPSLSDFVPFVGVEFGVHSHSIAKRGGHILEACTVPNHLDSECVAILFWAEASD